MKLSLNISVYTAIIFSNGSNIIFQKPIEWEDVRFKMNSHELFALPFDKLW